MNWIKELYTIPVWKKYSQCNEECYLEHILKNIPVPTKMIVELGAWDGYHLSNTRHFIEKGYSALLIDGDNKGNDEVKLHFVDRDSVLGILEMYKTPKYFDLFCIDLDGNDIYIQEKVLSEYKPSVIIAEFNPIFPMGESKAITYNPNHTWNNDDYYGFSFSAGIKLAERFGYTCIFQNDNLNMYFVENNVLTESLFGSEDKAIPAVPYRIDHGHAAALNPQWINY